MQSLGEKLVDELEANMKLRKRLAELLVTEPDIRLVLINAVLANVATKEDIRELRGEINQLRAEINQLRGEINQLRSEIGHLREEMYSNFKWTIGIVLTIWGATVIPILLRLIGAI